MLIAAYPGSFDPPTVAHLAVAEAALDQLGVDRIELVISLDPLGKDRTRQVRVHDRLSVIGAVAESRPWLALATTEHRLIADIAAGYDAIVMGADKWAQVLDAAWYDGSTTARDSALAALPAVGLAPRVADDGAGPPAVALPPSLRVVELDVHPSHRTVSATSVRAGRHEWMAAEATAFAERTGAWVDPERYGRWVQDHPLPNP